MRTEKRRSPRTKAQGPPVFRSQGDLEEPQRRLRVMGQRKEEKPGDCDILAGRRALTLDRGI